jgi:hypothetical protein
MDVMYKMDDKINLENRLHHIEEICETYLDTPGFPKNVVMKHLIGVAKGEINCEEK